MLWRWAWKMQCLMVYDLLRNLRCYQWGCSPDALGGFWAIWWRRERETLLLSCAPWENGCEWHLDSRKLRWSISEWLTTPCGAIFNLQEADMRFWRLYDMWSKKQQTENQKHHRDRHRLSDPHRLSLSLKRIATSNAPRRSTTNSQRPWKQHVLNRWVRRIDNCTGVQASIVLRWFLFQWAKCLWLLSNHE